MPQIFHSSMNTISRATIYGAVFMVAAFGWLILTIARSSYVTGVGVVKDQPVPFSHQHHVADVGIDCRYCHASVEDSSFAGIPPTQTCMNCHSQLWTEAPILEPVRASYREDKPLVWNRVHDVPDFVYFDHSIHVKKGVACVRCHGDVAEMPLTWKSATLYMEWCLECHRHPQDFVGPPEAVFAAGSHLRAAPPSETSASKKQLQLASPALLTNCSICHR
jgi:hypothetical protein